MEKALIDFLKSFEVTHCMEVAIAELKRNGLNRQTTIKVLMQVLDISIVEADTLVVNSLAWS